MRLPRESLHWFAVISQQLTPLHDSLHETGWGTRVGVGAPEEANKAQENEEPAFANGNGNGAAWYQESKESPFYGSADEAATSGTRPYSNRVPQQYNATRRTSHGVAPSTPAHRVDQHEMQALPK